MARPAGPSVAATVIVTVIPLPQPAGLSGENLAAIKGGTSHPQFRLGRPCAGHPRLGAAETKAWIRGTGPRKTTVNHLPRDPDQLSVQEHFSRTALRSRGTI